MLMGQEHYNMNVNNMMENSDQSEEGDKRKSLQKLKQKQKQKQNFSLMSHGNIRNSQTVSQKQNKNGYPISIQRGQKSPFLKSTTNHQNNNNNIIRGPIPLSQIFVRLEELQKSKLNLQEKIQILISEENNKNKRNNLFKKGKNITSKKQNGTLKTLKTLKSIGNLQNQKQNPIGEIISEALSDKNLKKNKKKIRQSDDNNQNQSQNEYQSQHYSQQINSQTDLVQYFVKKINILMQEQKNTNKKLTEMQKNFKMMGKSQQLFKRDLQNVQQITRDFQNSRGHKKDKQKQSRLLNQTMESNRAFYEDKLIQLFEQMDKIKRQYFNIAQKLNQEDNIMNGLPLQNGKECSQRQKNFALKMQEILKNSSQSLPNSYEDFILSLKKQLSQNNRQLKKLRQQFDRLMSNVNHGSNQIRTLVIKPNQTKQEWKSLTTKINKTKAELTSTVKQLQGKIVINNEMLSTINQLQVSVGQCKLVLQRKCETVQFQKGLKRLQNRLNNFIRQTYEKEGIIGQRDAMIAKHQPWFCLSCDSQLKNYGNNVMKTQNNFYNSGNNNKYVQGETIHGKKVNPQNHMVRRPQSKIPQLPSFHDK